MAEPRRGFKTLNAWQRADELASLVFREAERLSARHNWLASQMMRSAVSVPANIAEGYGRGSQADYLRFLDIARGSLAELEYYIHFVKKEKLFSEDSCRQLDLLRTDTGRLLFGLWQSLKMKPKASWDHTGQGVREIGFDYEIAD